MIDYLVRRRGDLCHITAQQQPNLWGVGPYMSLPKWAMWATQNMVTQMCSGAQLYNIHGQCGQLQI